MTHPFSDSRISRPELVAWGLLLIAPALFCSNMIMARAMVGILPPISMAFLRWSIVALVLAVFCWRELRTKHQVLRREWPHLLFLGSLGMGLCGGPVYLGGELTTATNIGLIYASCPLFVALFAALFLKEQLHMGQIAGLIIGLFGVIWIIAEGAPSRLVRLSFNTGDLWICLATLSFAIYSVGLRHFPTRLSATLRLAAMAAGGALCHLPFMAAELTFWGREIILRPEVFAGLAVLVFISSIGAYATYGQVVRVLGAVRAGVILYIAPVYNAVFAMVLLGEMLTDFHLVGSALILPGLWLVGRGHNTQRA